MCLHTLENSQSVVSCPIFLVMAVCRNLVPQQQKWHSSQNRQIIFPALWLILFSFLFCIHFPLRSLCSSITWWESHLRQALAQALLLPWLHLRRQFIRPASHLLLLSTSSPSAPSTHLPLPRLQRFVHRAGTSSSTPRMRASAAVSQSPAHRSKWCSSSSNSSRGHSRTGSCWSLTVRLQGYRSRQAPLKKTRLRQQLQRSPQTRPQKAARSLSSHSCSRRSSISWNRSQTNRWMLQVPEQKQ